jgi:lipopolysaccharide biosynthesis glycosyltransferase|tara:strand:- start:2540 stop:3202 length:663 start_codon:yes stop_codon:yes gene_type:complete
MSLRIFIGWDSREEQAYDVCVKSLEKYTSESLDIKPIKREDLIEKNLYSREQPEVGSVEFTYTRFLAPFLSSYDGWSLFIDCDFLFTKDVAELFAHANDDYALMCVKHDYTPRNSIKMDGEKQVSYPRKNWSSCVLWNCAHPSNKVLTPEIVSTETGAYLHRFQFLTDDLIGEIPLEWNWLEGEYDKPKTPPAVIHFTNGGPWFENWQDVDYADLWRSYL